MKRKKYSLSHYRLTSFNQGELVPLSLIEVLPGDTVQQKTSAMLRVSPLIRPVMHPVHVTLHHWYVPFRILWEKWEEFITQANLDSGLSFPTLTFKDGVPSGSLADHLGVPIQSPGAEIVVSAIPFRAYHKIWNEFYRDQDLQTEISVSLDSGNTDVSAPAASPRRVNWVKDLFTTARPWEQKGDDVRIPVSTEVGIHVKEFGANRAILADLVPSTSGNNVTANLKTRSGANMATNRPDIMTGPPGTINDLRKAFSMQKYQEARARYGSRYVEYLKYLGVRSSDARLQRPEYLGGSRDPVQFSEVLQTAPGDNDSETDTVGALKGHGIGAMKTRRWRRFFEEHGYIMTLAHVKPIPVYTSSLHRHWSKRLPEDFYQKELAHIGSQAIRLHELYNPGDGSVSPNETFGYADRYYEYREHYSSVSGKFRPGSANVNWHMARSFASKPVLNSDFITCTPTDRIYADKTVDQIQLMAKHSIQARRMVARGNTRGV